MQIHLHKLWKQKKTNRQDSEIQRIIVESAAFGSTRAFIEWKVVQKYRRNEFHRGGFLHGAPVGVDVAAVLQPCVAQVMAVVLGPEPEAGSHGAVLDMTHHPVPKRTEVIAGKAIPNPCFAQHLSGLRACLEAVAAAVSLRFAVPSRAVTSALWQLCPAWASVDPGYLLCCLAGPHGSRVEQVAQQRVLGQVQVAADELRDGLTSADALTQALLPVLIAAGAGFHACLV